MVSENPPLNPRHLKQTLLHHPTVTAVALFPAKVFAILAALVQPTNAAPLQSPRPDQSLGLIDGTNNNNNGNNSIIPNFQDLSAILSLLAADVVEEKFCTPSTPTWERMSSAWSIFGIMGLGRACIKIAAGLDVAEAAGFRLNGAGAFTSKRTKAAFSAWPAGSSCPGPWCDDSGQLLGSAYVPPGTWKKPFIIMHGYSQCPSKRGVPQFYWEMWNLFLVAFLTIGLELGPLLLLWNYTPNEFGSLTMAIGIISSLAGGCGLPIVITSLNNPDVPHLADLAPSEKKGTVRDGLSQTGDLIMATSDQRIVKWQTKSASWTRSGDDPLVRFFAVISLLAILGSYILNYALLGAAQRHITYSWLGFQTIIMTIRYIIWAQKPNILHVRHCALVYTVMGSLHDPLPVTPSQNAVLHAEKRSGLTENLIEVAVAAACSKLSNHDISTAMYDSNALLQLAGTAPCDILLAQRCHLQDIPEENRGSYHVVRLPWPFIEELYLAQGLLLGPNPRSYEGLDAAAVFDHKRFMGLTSVHPEFHSSHTSSIVGRTVDGVAVCEDLTRGRLAWQGWFLLDHSMDLEHHRFWQNVDGCRNTAVANGPASVEIHAVYDGGRATWNRVHQRVRGVDSALELVRQICVMSARKDHDSCGAHCMLYRLGKESTI